MSKTVGLILCGGFSKKLGPNTEEIPKPLVEIKEGYTILDKQLFDFKYAGVDEVYLLTGFLSEKIKERYSDEYCGVKINYVTEDEPLGTLNAIKLGMDAIGPNKQCIIRNSNIVADINLKKMIELGESSEYPVSIFVTQIQSPYGIVEISSDH
jgi:NDP-sugar pyrophosphorylase family protein